MIGLEVIPLVHNGTTINKYLKRPKKKATSPTDFQISAPFDVYLNSLSRALTNDEDDLPHYCHHIGWQHSPIFLIYIVFQKHPQLSVKLFLILDGWSRTYLVLRVHTMATFCWLLTHCYVILSLTLLQLLDNFRIILPNDCIKRLIWEQLRSFNSKKRFKDCLFIYCIT